MVVDLAPSLLSNYIQVWKKVYEQDLSAVIFDMAQIIERPAVLILSGPVGAGKTTLIKYFINVVSRDILKNTNNSDQVSSPSYSIINESDQIAHADFYRLKDKDEITHLEIALYGEDKEYFLIEWGRPFLREIRRELGDCFSYYELDIEIKESKDSLKIEKGSNSSRNLYLKKIK